MCFKFGGPEPGLIGDEYSGSASYGADIVDIHGLGIADSCPFILGSYIVSIWMNNLGLPSGRPVKFFVYLQCSRGRNYPAIAICTKYAAAWPYMIDVPQDIYCRRLFWKQIARCYFLRGQGDGKALS